MNSEMMTWPKLGKQKVVAIRRAFIQVIRWSFRIVKAPLGEQLDLSQKVQKGQSKMPKTVIRNGQRRLEFRRLAKRRLDELIQPRNAVVSRWVSRPAFLS